MRNRVWLVERVLWTGCYPTPAFDPKPRSNQQIAPPYKQITAATCKNFLVDRCMDNEKVSVNLESRKPFWRFDDKKLHADSGGTLGIIV